MSSNTSSAKPHVPMSPSGGRLIGAAEFKLIAATDRRVRSAETNSVKKISALNGQAWQHGYREGLRQAMSEVNSVVRSLGRYRDGDCSPVHQLVFSVLRKILGERDADNIVSSIAAQAIVESCEKLEMVTLCIHPCVASAVEQRISKMDADDLRLVIKTDERLDATDCEIHTVFGIIDAGLNAQLDALQQIVASSLKDISDA